MRRRMSATGTSPAEKRLPQSWSIATSVFSSTAGYVTCPRARLGAFRGIEGERARAESALDAGARARGLSRLDRELGRDGLDGADDEAEGHERDAARDLEKGRGNGEGSGVRVIPPS